MKSTFFSYASQDRNFVGQVTPKFRPDLVYDYDLTTAEGENFQKETGEDGLSRTRLFVVFWSQAYWKSEACMAELQTAGRLFKAGVIPYVLVLRLDETPIDARCTDDPELKGAIGELGVFTSSLRSSLPNVTLERAADLIAQKQMLIGSQIQVPECRRDDLAAAFRTALERDAFTFRPAMWISGFNGNGRTALVRDFCRYLAPNAPVHEIDVNECSLPGLLVLKIEAQVFGANEDRLRALAADGSHDSVEAAALAAERVRDAGGFLMLRQVRVQEERAELPDWIFDLCDKLQVTNRPALFVVAQLAPKSDCLARVASRLGSLRSPPLTFSESLDYCKQIVRARGIGSNRIDENLIERVAYTSGGNIDLLIKMLDAVIGSDLESSEISLLLDAQHEQFSVQLTGYINWCVFQLAGNESAFRILTALNVISPCSPEALRRLVSDYDFDMDSFHLVRKLGLVEQYGEGLFRLSPLLSARLEREFGKPERVAWRLSAQRRFATMKVQFIDKDDPADITLIEGQVKASLLAGIEPTSDHLASFVTVSHIFQAGIILYSRRAYGEAFDLFKRAANEIDKFSDNTKSEVFRYLGMTAVRNGDGPTADMCIKKLRANINNAAVADFVEGFRAEVIEKNFSRSADLYLRAWKDANERSQNSREARAIRSYISVAMKMSDADYVELVRYAERAVTVSRTHWNLSSRARVYLRYRLAIADLSERKRINEIYIEKMNELRADPGGLSGWHEVFAEELAAEGNFSDAAEEMKDAIKNLRGEKRIEFWQRRWRYLLSTRDVIDAGTVIKEIEALRSDPDWKTAFALERRETKEFYKRALNVTGSYSPVKMQQMFP